MRLSYALQSDAQAKADQLHQSLIADTPAYAQSVKDGQTLRWAIPYQDKDKLGNPLGANWYVDVDDRTTVALTPTEVLSAGLAIAAPKL